MSALRIQSVAFSPDAMAVRFADNRELTVPLAYFPRLAGADPADLGRWSLIGRGLGVHWEEIDEDLSVENILTAYSRHHQAAYAAAGWR